MGRLHDFFMEAEIAGAQTEVQINPVRDRGEVRDHLPEDRRL